MSRDGAAASVFNSYRDIPFRDPDRSLDNFDFDFNKTSVDTQNRPSIDT